MSVVLVYEGCYHKKHRLGSLSNRHLFPHSSGGWKSKIKILSGLLCSEAFFHGLQRTIFSLCSFFLIYFNLFIFVFNLIFSVFSSITIQSPCILPPPAITTLLSVSMSPFPFLLHPSTPLPHPQLAVICSPSMSLSPFSLLVQFLYQIPHMSEIMQYLSFSNWLFQLA